MMYRCVWFCQGWHRHISTLNKYLLQHCKQSTNDTSKKLFSLRNDTHKLQNAQDSFPCVVQYLRDFEREANGRACTINQSIKTHDAQASLGYTNRYIRCDGRPSTRSNEQHDIDWPVHSLTLFLPQFTRTSATPCVIGAL